MGLFFSTRGKRAGGRRGRGKGGKVGKFEFCDYSSCFFVVVFILESRGDTKPAQTHVNMPGLHDEVIEETSTVLLLFSAS